MHRASSRSAADEAVSVERRHGNSRDKSLATNYSIIKEHALRNIAARSRCFVHGAPTCTCIGCRHSRLRLTTIASKGFPWKPPANLDVYLSLERDASLNEFSPSIGGEEVGGENTVSQFHASFIRKRFLPASRNASIVKRRTSTLNFLGNRERSSWDVL